MKSAFITLLIISFVGVAIFGFVTMVYGAGHGMGCIASIMNGSASCPLNSMFDFTVFHLDAFKIFSKAVFSTIFLILIVGLAFSGLPKPINGKNEDESVFYNDKIFLTFYTFKEQLNSWLSLKENSPAFNFRRLI